MKFGVVGTNFITDRVIAAGRLVERFELAAVCSRSIERAIEFSARHGIPRAFTSLDEMLAGDTVDAVYIASPNACHARQAIASLDAGKHVLCEKPLASNAREAGEMVAAARANGRLLMEAMKPTLTPNFGVLRDNLHRVGTPRRWFAAFGKYSSRYDALKLWAAGEGGELPNTFNPRLANGAAMDIGVYAIYPMVALFGPPKKVQASVIKLPGGVDGHGAVNFEFEGGMLGTVLYSKMVDMALPWEVEGEEGTIRGDAINSIRRIGFRPRGGDGERAPREDEWEDIAVAATAGVTDHPAGDYTYEIAHFIDTAMSGRTESETNTHKCSIATLEIVDEIRRQAGIVYPADRP